MSVGKLLPPLRWFYDSPGAGDPECICSVCGNQITEEDAPPIRFLDKLSNLEARFHDDCFKAIYG